MAEEWVASISDVAPDGYEVTRLESAKDAISRLLMRKLAIKDGGDLGSIDSEFDDIDILVVDYDLVHLDGDGSRTTGEGVARLARNFSNCGVAVVMNQFKGTQFDLGMRGHLESHADLNIDAELIGTPSLWKTVSPAAGTLNPTTWTPLESILASGRSLKELLGKSKFDQQILPSLGLDEDALVELSDTAYGFLNVEAETSEQLLKTTLEHFLKRNLDEDVYQPLADASPEFLFGFASFRLRKWLERAVLRPMDVLIDIPHLIDRLPFLIDADKADVTQSESWTAACLNPNELLKWDAIDKFFNPAASAVLGKQVFNWYLVSENDEIGDLQDKFLQNDAEKFHLVEDTSRFVPVDSLTRFRADFHNFGDRRAIEKIPGISYGPQRRMRFG